MVRLTKGPPPNWCSGAGRKVYAQGMGTEALSRILRWVVAQTDVQVAKL